MFYNVARRESWATKPKPLKAVGRKADPAVAIFRLDYCIALDVGLPLMWGYVWKMQLVKKNWWPVCKDLVLQSALYQPWFREGSCDVIHGCFLDSMFLGFKDILKWIPRSYILVLV